MKAPRNTYFMISKSNNAQTSIVYWWGGWWRREKYENSKLSETFCTMMNWVETLSREKTCFLHFKLDNLHWGSNFMMLPNNIIKHKYNFSKQLKMHVLSSNLMKYSFSITATKFIPLHFCISASENPLNSFTFLLTINADTSMKWDNYVFVFFNYCFRLHSFRIKLN